MKGLLHCPRHPRYLRWLLPFLLAGLLAGCSPDFADMAEQRQALIQKSKGDIEIVALRDNSNNSFMNGVLMATDEVNQRPGKLLGRKLKVNIEQDGETLEEAKPIIRRIAANPKITAVIGHRKSSIAIPASVIYEKSQVIFIPPFATGEGLTGHGFQYVFRMIPSNKVMAEQLASVAKSLGYQRMVMLYARDDFSRELAFLFEEAALKHKIQLVQRISFFEKEDNYRPVISQFSNESFDAVFIASAATPSAKMVKQLREMGVNHTVLGSDLMNNPNYLKTAGATAQNTIVPDVSASYKKDKNIQEKIQQYKNRFGENPDYYAAQGYDAVMLLAHAIETSNSALPSLLSSTLHYMPAWVGITGIHDFDSSGELLGKKYSFKTWQDGEWQRLPAIQTLYLLGRFEKALHERNKGKYKPTAFSTVFAERMHEDDHKLYLLDLAQEILRFKRIGVIYENTSEGRKASGYDMLKTLAERKNLNVVGCELPLSVLNKEQIDRAVIACYGKLSLNADALFVSPNQSISPDLIQRLNRSLAFYKIPAISLDERNTDPSISLLLGKRSDVNLQGEDNMKVYSGLLKNLKVHEFAERLKGMPDITVNLTNLQRYGFADEPFLDLSPDTFLHTANDPILGDKP